MPSMSSPSPSPNDTAPGQNHMKAVLDILENLQGDPYLKATRAFPLLHDPFVDLGAVFYDGIRADHGEEVPEDNETPEEHFEDDPAKPEDFINVLRNAASLAHAEDTCKLKDLCPSFLLNNPAKPGAALDPPIVKEQSKSLRRWNHKDTAQALCPMVNIKTFDEDPRAYMNSILNGKRKLPSFKKLPSCLYEESLADPKLKHSGFLRGKPLEQACVILILIISLSSAKQWTSEVTGLDLYELYISIIDSLKQTDHPWVKETLDHWKRKNGCHTTAASDDSDSDDMEGFLDDPPECSPQRPSLDHPEDGPSASQYPSSPPPPPPECQHQLTPPPPPSEGQCQLTPPPPSSECQHQPTPPPPNPDEDEDNRLTPPPSTPVVQTPQVGKRKAPGTAKHGKAPRRKC
ncbi:uncharacterized protein HD556DRAFT_1312285 [Suillus plorans]|uniref:Uncharacterized protein n=1 Tax=Suillus plorans TaxID=116603 RepID=A0A9P7AFX1_9AGAM|nr:uncharacterized protein HD556DRAFT_1312285 [Suillus plorans]KAG1787995.1 hypothetical protein HD556DRAFT_1312285 [Suillus plorans]